MIAVIVMPLAYGLAVSSFFTWLHRRKQVRQGSPQGQAPSGGKGASR